MLLGEYNHSIDDKSRLIIPSKFRDDLGSTFIVTKGLDNCLFIYSISEWQTFEAKLKSLPLTNQNARVFTRFFAAGATECQLDKQGRIVLPAHLRQYAGLTKDTVIIGAITRAEIWDKEKWTNYTSEDNISVEEVASQMSDLGI